MAVYCISYTLTSNNYDRLHQAIRDYGTWWHQSGSVWIIETNQTARQVIDNLRTHIGVNDKLMVFRMMGEWWASGYTTDETNWMQQRRF